jgi:hypothetical protein
LPAALGNLPPFFSYFTAIVLGAAALLWFSAFQFKMRPAYLIYSALLIAVCACNSNLPALARVMSLAFPLYVKCCARGGPVSLVVRIAPHRLLHRPRLLHNHVRERALGEMTAS